ncbi:MAG: tetratricopeptide repeat protein [Sinobacteraceae bacterium]|nr:tetratricopeptide repeat protein [Nevskiaceae bacterium]MBV9317434.1 tetratricopeptide repeat protein [Gammaproteobacteria bacterium]
MRRRPSIRALLVAALATLLAAAAADARRHDPEKLSEGHIRDLHFGDVLFLYFQQDDAHDFEALTRVLAYQHWGRMPHHSEDAELIAGSLYLQEGMHNEAGEIFQRLLTDNVSSGVRNRAWLYLAQVWYARGYYDRAEGALRKVNGRMSPDYEAQKELLLANVFMHQGKYDDAIELLTAWRGGPIWSAYARFNLGVALVRANRLADADPFLSAVGTMIATGPELAALRDRANLALGFAYLQADQPERARVPLERVRLNGPYSNKALLGTGWAQAALGDYQAALTPWMELRGRDVLDAAVQESYLAVPYAFMKMNANAQSAEYYESAVTSFDNESTRLDAAIAHIRQGDMLREVLASGPAHTATDTPLLHGWFRDLRELPRTAEAPYLYTVLAGHAFQEGVKNYRDMVYLGTTLERWGDSMDAYQDMIETRERAYAERLPKVDGLLASGTLQQLQQRNVELENELRTIESHHDVGALGTETERSQWTRVQRIEAGLAGLPDSPETAEVRARLALVKGVLYYRLNDAYGARAWQEHRSLKDLSLALHEAQSRWIRVERARHNVPQNNGEFAERVASLRERIAALQVRLAATEQRQSTYLAQIAVQELEQQKARLGAYEVQARFALATMYDRAATEAANRSKAAAPQQGNGASEPAEQTPEQPGDQTPPPAPDNPAPPEPPR